MANGVASFSYSTRAGQWQRAPADWNSPMREIVWEISCLDSVGAFHDLAQTSLEFPHHYGRNQDAFWDCLNEIVEPTVVRVIGWEASEPSLKNTFEPYLDMCREYEEKTSGVFKLIID